MIAGSKFQFQQTILIFLDRIFSQKGLLRSKIEKLNVTIESLILKLA